MLFLVAGIVLMLLKYLEVEPVAALAWWWVLSPFAMAVAWWAWADSSGYTKRQALKREEKRRADRIDKSRSAMGLLPKKRR